MSGLDIGLSGIAAAQKGLEVIGNNIANAATDGFHRQRLNFTPGLTSFRDGFAWGTGVDISGVVRVIDNLLEKEILQQQAIGSQVEKELSTLKTIESTFNELASGSSLSKTLDDFFAAIRDLSAHPDEVIWQLQLLSAAEAMTFQFRTLGESLDRIEARLQTEANAVVDQINELSAETADLNGRILQIEVVHGNANNLRDQRDQRISTLSKLIGISTTRGDLGVVNVIAAGVPIVLGKIATELKVGLVTSTDLGLGAKGTSVFNSRIEGGQISALIKLRNNIVADIHADLDALAKTLVDAVNTYHVQGVGSDGAFSSKTGILVTDHTALSSLSPAVKDGTLYVRVTNTTTGAVTRTAVTIDADANLAAAATAISSAVSNVTATTLNSGNKLKIDAAAGYKFDFIPAPLPNPDPSPAPTFGSGYSSSKVHLSGLFTGSANKTLTFTVSGSGSLGNGTISIDVSDGSSTIATLNVGSGYVVGTELKLGNGLRIAFDAGTLAGADTFQVTALADSDTSGLLAAAGINTFLSGTEARTIALRADIADAPGSIATAMGSELVDNANALRIAELQDSSQSALKSLSITDFYHSMVTQLGQDISNKRLRHENTEAILLNLGNRRSDTSGVDVNEEAARILMFQQIFQAMARYINSVNTNMTTLLELL